MKLGVVTMGALMKRAAILAATAAALSGCSGEPGAPEPEPYAVSASKPPPPISGGTLLVAADGKTAVAADADRDRISVVDLALRSVLAEFKLEPSDEPGRVVEGPPGRAHVALRRGGAVVTINLVTKEIVRRTPVCPAPRGMAYDAGNVIHVACAGGELVTLSADTGAEIRRLRLQPDLRDVVVQGDKLLVSVFRAAQVLTVDAGGAVVDQRPLPFDPFLNLNAAVAWRMVPFEGGAAIVHQRAASNAVSTSPGGYVENDGCGEGIVRTAVSFIDAEPVQELKVSPTIAKSALPVDLALSPDGSRFAIVGAGSDSLFDMSVAAFRSGDGFDICQGHTASPVAEGQPVAVAFASSVRVVQTREPPLLVLSDGAIIELPGESVSDTGHELFHAAPNPSVSMACASCHPEGRDDGLVWSFFDVGLRRTQSLAGGVLATAPLHWNGELDGFDSLMGEVFTGRMGGPAQSPRRVRSMALWVDSIPALPLSPTADVSAAERGKAIFEDASVGCATCHSGPRLTNNKSVDIGTGGAFQVPTLRGVAARAPFMHDGCAPTLLDRFNPACGGDNRHGYTSHLTLSDLTDLVSYLETL
jgi:hypothetical protein